MISFFRKKGQTLIDLLDTKNPLKVLSFKEIKAIL